MPDFHPDLRAARFLPRGVIAGPRSLALLRLAGRAAAPGARFGAAVTEVGDGVTARVFRPTAVRPGMPAVLWIHGGGMVIGDASIDDAFCARLRDELGAVVVSVDYRLAPEHPFPVPLEDCWTALRWLAEQPGIDPARIALAGASAGAGLAAALALLARDRGDIRPAFQLLIYPMLDDRTALRYTDERRLRLWNQRSNRFGWSAYVGPAAGSAGVPVLAAPARHPDLAGLPPAWIGVGTNDLFHDEDVAYAKRLADAGVDCTLEVIPGAYHGFEGREPRARVSREFVDGQVAALRRGLAVRGRRAVG